MVLKSAYELALEKTGGALEKRLTAEQKAKLAEVDGKYRARLAEQEILLAQQIQAARVAGEVETAEKLAEELAAEKARIEAARNAEKDRIRKQ